MGIAIKTEKSDLFAYFLMMITVSIWASTWPLGRWMVSETHGETIPQLMIASIRYFIVVPIFLILLRIWEGSFQFKFVKEHWKYLFVMGLFSVTLYQAGYLFGETYTSASDASLIVYSAPIFVLILTTVFFGYKLSLRKVIGTLLAFIGVFVIVGFSPNTDVEDRLLGNALILLAAVTYGSYTVLLKELMKKHEQNDPNRPSSLTIVTWVSVIGSITLIPISFLISPEYLTIEPYLQIPERIWFGILYLALLSTILAYLAYVEGVNRLDANRAVIFVNFIPLFGILLSGIFLGEKIDLVVHSISFLLILAGVTLVNKKSNNNNNSKEKKTSFVEETSSNEPIMQN
jgi:drug/metabolite transporter (DMT)-like permease